MAPYKSSTSNDSSARINELIHQLTQAGNALEETVGGEIDSVVDSTGRPILLQQAQQALQESEALQKQTSERLQAIFDSLPANIVIVNQKGTITSFNEHWRRFGIENGWPEPENTIGQNYLAICRNAQGDHQAIAKRIGQGIEGVLAGRLGEYCDEYPCSSPSQLRWFQALVSPLPSNLEGEGALVMHIDITQRMQAEQALRESEGRFRAVFEKAGIGIAIVGDDGIPKRINHALEQMLGRSAESLCRMRFDEFSHPEDLARDEELFAELLEGKRDQYSLQKRFLAHGGNVIWAELSVSILEREDKGDSVSVLALVVDNTERIQREGELRHAAILFNNTKEGVVITDQKGSIVSVNAAFREITGYSQEEVQGRNPRLLKSGYQGRAFYEAMWMSLQKNDCWEGELWNRRKDGTLYREWLHISAVRDGAGTLTHYIGVFSDVTRVREFQERLDYLAHHEPLTDLANRRLFVERGEHALTKAQEKGELLVVGVLDIDDFKEINETLGYDFGDLVLQEVGTCLKQHVRAGDTLAFEGGNKYWILFEDVTDRSQAHALVERLWQGFSSPHEVQERELNLTASLGFSLYPGDADRVETLRTNAEASMYHVKRQGGNGFRFYSDDLVPEAFKRMNLRQGLHRALANNEFIVHYQPQINLESGKVVGFEALLRWNHPKEGFISPARFIPVAEEMGLMTPISDWILREACVQGKAWLDAGIDFGRIAVNVSAAEMETGQVGTRLCQILTETGLPGERLEIEITETSAMRSSEEISQMFLKARDQGVRLALDDFGTGYSSLVRLRDFPLDKIKIDRSFVAEIPDNEECTAIVRATIAMAHALGLIVIAEGVETERQRRFLLEEGCDCGQGFFWARPQASPDWV